jgi:hypothetical protein
MSTAIPPPSPNPPRPDVIETTPVVYSAPPTGPQRLKWYAICITVGLLVGLIPSSIWLYQAARDRDQAQRQVHAAELELSLARSAVLARSGDYNAARDAASNFFSLAERELAADASALAAADLTTLRLLLAERDTVITLLARSDPAGADRVATMYVTYRPARSDQ